MQVALCAVEDEEDGGEDAPSGEPADSGTHTETHTKVYGGK